MIQFVTEVEFESFLLTGVIGLVFLALALLAGDVFDGIFNIDFLDSGAFSVAALAAFVGAFGFSGAIAMSLSGLLWLAIVAGLLAGVGAAWFAVSLTRWLRQGEAHAMRSDSLLGAAGRVITDIPENGFGEVRLYTSGRSHKRAARAEVPIPSGAEVWVREILSPTAVAVMPAVDSPPAANNQIESGS